LNALLKAHKMSIAGQLRRKPNIGILEFRSATDEASTRFSASISARKVITRTDCAGSSGVKERRAARERVQYRFDLPAISAQEFFLRFTLNHPLVQAVSDHKVCVVNSFRSELRIKKACSRC